MITAIPNNDNASKRVSFIICFVFSLRISIWSRSYPLVLFFVIWFCLRYYWGGVAIRNASIPLFVTLDWHTLMAVVVGFNPTGFVLMSGGTAG